MLRTLTLVLFCLCAALGGCASNSGIVPLSEDTYMLSRSSSAGAFADMGALKAKVIRDANEFAAKKGKVAVALSSEVTRPAIGFPSFDYQFRLVEKDSPEARGIALVPRPDVVVQDGRANDPPPPQDSDLYTELNKLDDLRKRGLITDAEYEAEKQKLLRR